MKRVQDASSIKETYELMYQRLHKIVPDFELKYKAELAFEINTLKKEKNAVILGHNYMEPALYHSIPDYVGDSLGLSRIAEASSADRIIFCGVKFMAETAKILNPTRMVLLPVEFAGCSLASSIKADDVRALKARFPGVPVVTYINTYADVKAETDICCTSSNAVDIVKQLDSDIVICLPDEFLARNVAKETGKKILYPSSELYAGEQGMLIWNGKCEVHEQFTVGDIENVRKQFPDTVILSHPECPPEVVEASDFSGSTSAMVSFVQHSKSQKFLILTECSMADNIAAENQDREFLGLCSVRCPHMNQITLEDTLECLRHDKWQIEIDEEIRIKAKKSLDRMLEMSKN